MTTTTVDRARHRAGRSTFFVRAFPVCVLAALFLSGCGGEVDESADSTPDSETTDRPAQTTGEGEGHVIDLGKSGEQDPAHAAGDHGGQEGKPNRLIHEKSPYLLQHAYNPVDWHPWGEEALSKAKAQDKPIFVSIGYSTCHWCHVMERESFENPEIAALMNQYFICIKIDREERPDIDQLYMTAVQAMTGHGGWPMSVFLTPDLEPYFAGTYFPPEDRGGRPGFPAVITQLGQAWQTQREKVTEYSGRVALALKDESARVVAGRGGADLEQTLLDGAYTSMESRFDARNGGFADQPKFPTPHNITFLLRYAHRTDAAKATEMARKTLDEMAKGGIHDHLAGGFHRYSVDRVWLVPHFEKMLYDQAGLAIAYTDGWLATGDPVYRKVAEGIFDYVMTYMTDEGGAFYSAEDADSEGVEGKFYVWSTTELDEILGAERSARFKKTYNCIEQGNWEHANIPHIQSTDPLMDEELAKDRAKLLAVRDERIRPHLDDKIIVSWNGFMIEAFARAGRAFDDPRLIEAAERAARFLHENLWREDGRLLRHYRNGPADVLAYLDDYAYLGRAYVALYETTFHPEYLTEAKKIATRMEELFGSESGAFIMYGKDGEKLLATVIEIYDGAMPSGNSAAATFLLRLGHITADSGVEERGWRVLEAFSGSVAGNPSAYLELLNGLDFALGPITELVIAGDPEDDVVRSMFSAVREAYRPNMVRAFRTDEDRDPVTKVIPYLESQIAIDGKATAYVCESYACKLPVHDAPALVKLLGLD